MVNNDQRIKELATQFITGGLLPTDRQNILYMTKITVFAALIAVTGFVGGYTAKASASANNYHIELSQYERLQSEISEIRAEQSRRTRYVYK